MNVVDFYNDIRATVFYNLEVPVYSDSTHQNVDVALPCLIMSRRSSYGDFTFSGVGFRRDLLTFSIKSRDIKQAEILRDHLISVMNFYIKGSADGTDGYLIAYAQDSGNFNRNSFVYTRNISFDVMYKMPTKGSVPNITSRGGGLGAFLLGQY